MTPRTITAWITTLAWASFWTYNLYTNWCEASQMAFNEWGDFFAGVFAPLAFMWLVVGYFQQGEELRQNTLALQQQEQALQYQVEELKQSVQQQKEMVKVTQEELEINRVSIEREYRKEKLRAQPLIRKTGGESTPDKENIRHLVLARNIGHLINRVELSIENSTLELSLEKDFFDNWDYESEKRLIFRHPASSTLSINDSFELHLRYLDGIGEQSSQVLYFTADKRGNFEFSSESLA
ncbi:hypothetical protein [Stutzerimonas degradans]|uniref:hypothetical protein n=1 Tax=Stutzerimonas degradans TaxID=2968968 RepID=UPI0012D97110|nr:hypothetical protein [Stutzerimonas degradans]MTZ14643.1 hypothetical protein [Stutzerimonas degradans]NHC10421.1 hypothetical protein [Stutzerimonas degradans]NHW01969.1 hypothetical protein [Stutzerimonas degradans]